VTLDQSRGAPHMNRMSRPVDIARVQRCPICSKSAAEQFQPFCSRRCADVDLNRWLSGVYVVPAKPEEDEDGRVEDEELPEGRQVR
jgi:endogenous inhibitor of DNA gyrase (YacG/DUF329 family)